MLYTHVLCTHMLYTYTHTIYIHINKMHTHRESGYEIFLSLWTLRKSWTFHNSMRVNASPSDSVTRTAHYLPLQPHQPDASDVEVGGRCLLASFLLLPGQQFSALVPISVSRGIFKSPPTPINTASLGRGLGTGAFQSSLGQSAERES